MSDTTVTIIMAIVKLFGVVAVGWLARRLGYIREEDLSRWTHFVIDFLFPLLVFHTIIEGFQAERMGELWMLPVIGFGIVAFGALCGLLLRSGLRTRDSNLVRTFLHLCAINNYGFLPIILVADLWGRAALANLFFLNLGSSIGYWTIGVGLLGGTDVKKVMRNVFSSPMIALFLALVLCMTRSSRFVPEVILKISELGGAAAVPCILVLIGASLYPFPTIEHKRDVAFMTVVRLALLPVLMILILKWLPISEDVRNIAFIVALMPVSISSVVITRRFGGCPDFAARAAIVTTVLSIATIPFGMWLLLG